MTSNELYFEAIEQNDIDMFESLLDSDVPCDLDGLYKQLIILERKNYLKLMIKKFGKNYDLIGLSNKLNKLEIIKFLCLELTYPIVDFDSLICYLLSKHEYMFLELILIKKDKNYHSDNLDKYFSTLTNLDDIIFCLEHFDIKSNNDIQVEINKNNKFQDLQSGRIYNKNQINDELLLERPVIEISKERSDKILNQRNQKIFNACACGNMIKVKDLLLNNNIDVNFKRGQLTPLELAYNRDNLELINILLTYPEVNYYFGNGESILLRACREDKISVVGELVKQNKINLFVTHDHDSPMKITIKKANVAILKLLLSHPESKNENEIKKMYHYARTCKSQSNSSVACAKYDEIISLLQ